MTAIASNRTWGTEKVPTLFVEGDWSDRNIEKFIDQQCRGLIWRAPRGSSCDPLVELAGTLQFLEISSDRRMNDVGIEHLAQLQKLNLWTRAKNSLNLDKLPHLRSLDIDDRPDLRGLATAPARYMRLSFTKRPLREFQDCLSLIHLVLETPRAHVVEISADMPLLENLALISGRVESLEGLNAPGLLNLTVQGARTGELLDLSPLHNLASLQSVMISGPLARRRQVEELRGCGRNISVRDLVD